MKIIIVCDGRATRVFDAASGERVDNVRKVTFTHEAGQAPIATLELILPELDASEVTALTKSIPLTPPCNSKPNSR
jgi:hypothetical protein